VFVLQSGGTVVRSDRAQHRSESRGRKENVCRHWRTLAETKASPGSRMTLHRRPRHGTRSPSRQEDTNTMTFTREAETPCEQRAAAP